MSIYARLAAGGIRRNKQLYLPYILMSALMAMMFYIVCFLSENPFVAQTKGSDSLIAMLKMGIGVMAVFSAIFLFYTNSFLIKRRKREFGLYSVLGLGKRNIVQIMIWETLMVGAGSIVFGIGAGILFSKLAELLAMKILRADIGYEFYVSAYGIVSTLVVFAFIFLLILLNVIREIVFSKTITLLRSENEGEKPPRANWAAAAFGAVLLGAAYYMAIAIKQPISALLGFFVAVLMVIAATYLLFIAGSVAFCKVLQKNKRFYYRAKHFVSVSQMAYRMKRNGAGLASICILCTMVLVTLSTTFCLYAGKEKLVNTRYPREILIFPQSVNREYGEEFVDSLDEIFDEEEIIPKNVLDYTYTEWVCSLSGDVLTLENNVYSTAEAFVTDVRNVYFITQEDYSDTMGEKLSLSNGEVAIYTKGADYKYNSITFEGVGSFEIVKRLDEMTLMGFDAANINDSIYVIASDFSILEKAAYVTDDFGEYYSGTPRYYGFDTGLSAADSQAFYERLTQKLDERSMQYSAVLRQNEIDSFLGMYGGLFFLGIVFGGIFILAAALIVFYKQISEGYEDIAHFDILRKVGMSDSGIRKSVNSQVLMVFFAPLAVAGIHMCFAFPMLTKLLEMFALYDKGYMAKVSIACFCAFAAIYVALYALTSRCYYNIISAKRYRQVL